MSCPAPKKRAEVDVRTYTVHPLGPCDDARARVGANVSQDELQRCLREHVLPVLGCRSCLHGIVEASVAVQAENARLRADTEKLGDQVESVARELATVQAGLEEAHQQLRRVEQERDDLRKVARVARQRAADEAAANLDTVDALAAALRERDAARAALESSAGEVSHVE